MFCRYFFPHLFFALLLVVFLVNIYEMMLDEIRFFIPFTHVLFKRQVKKKFSLVFDWAFFSFPPYVFTSAVLIPLLIIICVFSTVFFFSVFPSLSSIEASRESDSCVYVAHFCEGREELDDNENLVWMKIWGLFFSFWNSSKVLDRINRFIFSIF